MRPIGSLLLSLVILAAPGWPRHETGICGTTADTSRERLFLHRQSMRSRALRPLAIANTVNRDIGDIAVIEDSDGVVSRQNQFNLDQKSLQFHPVSTGAARYRYTVIDGGYDAFAAQSGSPLAALDDDDARAVTLPFPFPFFGAIYNQMYVNSDGNLTFTASDTASTDRSLGRMTSGPPRIAPLFDDLDPSRTTGGVRVLADAIRVVVSWNAVPEWVTAGIGVRQTFQVALFPDGRIEFAYSGINPSSAVTGIAPGGLRGGSTLVDFRNDPSGEYSGAVAERFGNTLTVDIVTVAQKFYEAHEDAYDYLVIYNDMDVPALPGAVAYESTIRSVGTGFGVEPRDDGRQYGSASRLLAVLNMGQLSQYPTNPNALVPARAAAGDTPLTTIGHEAGHLFLARASVRDPDDPAAEPMLGFQGAHWSFLFNSEASLMEGERILDKGPNAMPRFLTTETVQGFAPLDQYLMGFLAPKDVPDTFLVTGASTFLQTFHPLRGFAFDGSRRDIAIDEIVKTMGRRTPDHTVAQRRFRFAFILVTAQGKEPSAANLAKLETYRAQFESFFNEAVSNNASAETSFRRSMKLSMFPASGVVAGAPSSGTLSVQTPPRADLRVDLRTPNGFAAFPAFVTIPAGATSVSFTYSGVRAGVEELTAIPADGAYETAGARVQVADAAMLKLAAVSGDRQIARSAGLLPEPIVVRVTDENGLVYAGARIVATPSGGGSVTPGVMATTAEGIASFRWTTGAAAANQLRLSVEALPAVGLTIQAGSTVPVAASVVNAASLESGMAAGAIQTIRGANLASGQSVANSLPWPTTLGGVQVLLNGTAVPLLYVSESQINFYVPAETALGPATLAVATPSGAQAAATTTVVQIQPGIFPGAVLRAGTSSSAVSTPVRAGDYIEIYCTGLGPTRLTGGLQRTLATPTVFFGATPVVPVFSGLSPVYPGLYQVNVEVPAGVSGSVALLLSVNLFHSNEVRIAVE